MLAACRLESIADAGAHMAFSNDRHGSTLAWERTAVKCTCFCLLWSLFSYLITLIRCLSPSIDKPKLYKSFLRDRGFLGQLSEQNGLFSAE